MSAPRNVVFVLLDSLNRTMLGASGGTEFETPNLDRFASRAIRFTNHYSGSRRPASSSNDWASETPRRSVDSCHGW